MTLDTLLLTAGWMHFLLLPVSVAVPVLLDWRREFAHLSPLTRQVVWVHGIYVSATVIAFGVFTLVGRESMLAREPLGLALAAFIALFWGARLGIQVFSYPKETWPRGWHVVVARHGLTALFAYWTAVYALVAFRRA